MRPSQTLKSNGYRPLSSLFIMTMAQNTDTQGASHLLEGYESGLHTNEYPSRSSDVVRVGLFTSDPASGSRPDFYVSRLQTLENFIERHIFFTGTTLGERGPPSLATLGLYRGEAEVFVTTPAHLLLDVLAEESYNEFSDDDSSHESYDSGSSYYRYSTFETEHRVDMHHRHPDFEWDRQQQYRERVTITTLRPISSFSRHHTHFEYVVVRDRERCPICLESRLMFVRGVYRCHHRFCTTCVDTLYSTAHITCPLCREPCYLLESYHVVDPQHSVIMNAMFENDHTVASSLNGNNGEWTNADDLDQVGAGDVELVDIYHPIPGVVNAPEVVNPLHADEIPLPNVDGVAAHVADGQNLADAHPVPIAEGVPFGPLEILYAARDIRNEIGGDPFLEMGGIPVPRNGVAIVNVNRDADWRRFANRGHRGRRVRRNPQQQVAGPLPVQPAGQAAPANRQPINRPVGGGGNANPNAGPLGVQQRGNGGREVEGGGVVNPQIAVLRVPPEFNADEPVPYNVMLQLNRNEIDVLHRYTANREARLRNERNQRQADIERERREMAALQEGVARREQIEAEVQRNLDREQREAEDTERAAAELAAARFAVIQFTRIPTKRIWRRWGCWEWAVLIAYSILRAVYVVSITGISVWLCVRLAKLDLTWFDGVVCVVYVAVMHYLYKNTWWLTFDVNTGVGLEWEEIEHFWTSNEEPYIIRDTNYEVSAGYRGYFNGPAYVGLLPEIRMEYCGLTKFTAYHDGNLRRFITEKLKTKLNMDVDMQIMQNTIMVFAHEMIVQIKRGSDNIPFSPSTVFGLNWN